MDLDRGHIEAFALGGCARPLPSPSGTLRSSAYFSWELFCSVPRASHACKVSQRLAKSDARVLEHLHSRVCVQAEFGIGMPSSHRKQKICDTLVVLLAREESFKHWY